MSCFLKNTVCALFRPNFITYCVFFTVLDAMKVALSVVFLRRKILPCRSKTYLQKVQYNQFFRTYDETSSIETFFQYGTVRYGTGTVEERKNKQQWHKCPEQCRTVQYGYVGCTFISNNICCTKYLKTNNIIDILKIIYFKIIFCPNHFTSNKKIYQD